MRWRKTTTHEVRIARVNGVRHACHITVTSMISPPVARCTNKRKKLADFHGHKQSAVSRELRLLVHAIVHSIGLAR